MVACETERVTTQEQAAEEFYGGALTRITRVMPVIAVAAVPFLLWRFPWKVAAGFGFGAAVSVYNFWSLTRAVQALARRITEAESRESGGRIVFSQLLRYAMLGALAYVIFKSSVAALYGFLGGLCLPIAAIGCEAVFELYVALRRGM